MILIEQEVLMKRFLIIVLTAIFLSSCAYVVSRESRERATWNVPFEEVRKNPDAHVNNLFILGGIIVEAVNTREGTEIEAVHIPVDRYGNIIDTDVTEGRYIIRSSRQLDPMVYRKNRYITFAGTLTGSIKKMLNELEYNYPVFEAKEIYLWRDERYYMYPYGYPYYWYDPFYYPPYWYPPFRYRPYIYP